MKTTLRILRSLALLTLALTFPSLTPAQTVPPLINYQGKLVNSNNIPLPTGDYELRFSIWDAATGGTQVWGPQVFNGQTGPGLGPKVPVVQGWFNLMLGPVDTNGAAISSAFSATNRFVAVQVGANPAFSPRQQVLSAPFALKAEVATTAGTASVASNLLGQATTGPMTLYVATNGVDSNDGLTTSSPKRTIQAAVNLVPQMIYHNVTIEVGPGSYPEPFKVQGKHCLIGDVSEGKSPFKISGRDFSNKPVLGAGNEIRESGIGLYQLVFASASAGQNDLAVQDSRVTMQHCDFRTRNAAGLSISGAYVDIGDTTFTAMPTGPAFALIAGYRSVVNFFDTVDSRDPANLIKNRISDYYIGVLCTEGSTVLYTTENGSTEPIYSGITHYNYQVNFSGQYGSRAQMASHQP